MVRVPGFRSIVLSALLLLLTSGCGSSGPEFVPVTGVVTLDGQPVAEAGVLFTPVEGGRPGRAGTDSQGQFVISTFKTGDGLLVGKYAVTVAKVETAAVPLVDGLPTPSARAGQKWLLPKKYAATKTSGLSVEVKTAMKPVALELSSP
jgi:hypothetical protein